MKKLILLLLLALPSFGMAANSSWPGYNLGGATNVQYASMTFTAVGAAVNGVTICAAVKGRTIAILGWSISTDTAADILLHHQGGQAVRSNTASNIIGGGLFGANGGEKGSSGICYYPGLAQNQPLCADFSAACTTVEISVAYITY